MERSDSKADQGYNEAVSEKEKAMNGISKLALFAIPAMLALAACWWLAFGEGLHYFNREVSQEDRHAIVTNGTTAMPTAPLKISIKSPRNAALVIDRAEIDGGKSWVYAHNSSASRIEYGQIAWRLISESGITLKSGGGYLNIDWHGPQTLEPGERVELSCDIEADPRASILELIVE